MLLLPPVPDPQEQADGQDGGRCSHGHDDDPGGGDGRCRQVPGGAGQLLGALHGLQGQKTGLELGVCHRPVCRAARMMVGRSVMQRLCCEHGAGRQMDGCGRDSWGS